MKRPEVMAPDLEEAKFGWFYWVFQLLALPTVLVYVLSFFSLDYTWQNVCFFLLNFAVVLWIFFRFLSYSFRMLLLSTLELLKVTAIGITAYSFCTFFMGRLLADLYPGFFNVNDEVIWLMVRQEPVMMSLCTAILVPITEEVLYRGLLFGRLQQRSRLLGYLVSTIVFSLIHVAGYTDVFSLDLLFFCFLQYLPAGLILCAVYDFTGNIWSPIVIHMIVNALGIFSTF